jgi:hypothetical protein
MKIEDARIGMEVTLAECTVDTVWEISAIYKSGKIDVYHRPSGTDWNGYYAKMFKPVEKRCILRPVRVDPVAAILADVEKMLKRGTSFVCYDYHGKHRHCHVGLNELADFPSWGVHRNRAIVDHNGNVYLVCRELSDGWQDKNFNVAEIENWQVS